RAEKSRLPGSFRWLANSKTALLSQRAKSAPFFLPFCENNRVFAERTAFFAIFRKIAKNLEQKKADFSALFGGLRTARQLESRKKPTSRLFSVTREQRDSSSISAREKRAFFLPFCENNRVFAERTAFFAILKNCKELRAEKSRGIGSFR
ncbi:MAG: hypothetical protein IJY71_08410, partial [Clostridia bacterium]|nr:hypothetical protein [Clostridia bacterium]